MDPPPPEVPPKPIPKILPNRVTKAPTDFDITIVLVRVFIIIASRPNHEVISINLLKDFD
jgi:hypothetical protein